MNKQITSLTIIALSFAAIAGIVPAYAVPGDELASLACAGTGVGVAFDGTNLYWPKGLTSSTLGVCDTTGAVLADIPIVGLANPISTLSYDGSRGLFWAATADLGGSSREIYQIALDGTATFMFNVIADGASLTDGLAYDREDDSLWISGDVSSNIYHYDIDGTLIAGPIAIPSLPGCGNSGIASGVGVLYLGFNGCNVAQKHNKADLAFIEQYDIGTGRTEDMECDNVTFPGVDAIWTKDAFDIDIIAFEVPDGTCPVGGGEEPPKVGGEFLPINTVGLLVAGAQANAVWILSAFAVIGSVAFGTLYLTTKRY